MTCSKSDHKEKHTFTISNNILENTNEYKYLGFIINKKGNLFPTLEDLSCKAKKAIHSINSKNQCSVSFDKDFVKALR